MKNLLYIWGVAILTMLTTLTACNPRVWCERNYPPIPSFERIRVDSLIFTPGATVYDTVNFRDTLFHERVIVDSTGRASLKLVRDAYGNLLARCDALPDTKTITNERTIIKENQPIHTTTESHQWWKTALAVTCPLALAGLLYKALTLFVK